MQVIAVERWTFWTAVLLAVAGPIAATGFGVWSTTSNGETTSMSVAGVVATASFVLLLISVAMGGSRDPSVRTLKARS